MKKMIVILIIGILFIGANLYAAGNLTVKGSMGVTGNPAAYTSFAIPDSHAMTFSATRYGSEYDNAAQIFFQKARGNIDFPGEVIADDKLGSFKFRGWLQGGWRTGAGFVSYVEAVDAGSVKVAGILAFETAGLSDYGERMRVDSDGNVGIGTTSPNYKLEISGPLMLEDTSVPVTAAGHSGIYSNGGELYSLDESGNSTQISPHDPETGEWIFFSRNIKTGRVVRVNMEKLVKAVEKLTGEKFMVNVVEE